jgi:hypothetical protein
MFRPTTRELSNIEPFCQRKQTRNLKKLSILGKAGQAL